MFQGRLYYVRVSAYNMKGWGPPACSLPPSAAPSSEFVLIDACTCETEAREAAVQRESAVNPPGAQHPFGLTVTTPFVCAVEYFSLELRVGVL